MNHHQSTMPATLELQVVQLQIDTKWRLVFLVAALEFVLVGEYTTTTHYGSQQP